MKINTKFKPLDRVYIKELKVWAKVLLIFIDSSLQIQYKCRFFNNFDAKEGYFYEGELSLQEEGSTLGFKNEK
jgi:hypothetical protein